MKIKASKKFTTRFKKMAFGGDPDGEVLAVHSLYDDKGNVTEEIRIDEDDQVENHMFAYDALGKLLRHELVIAADGISETFVYDRDDKGRVIKETKFYGEDEGESTAYEYAAHIQPVRIAKFYADNDLESVELISYNDSELLIEHRKFDNENKLIEITEVDYNDKKLPVEKRVLDKNSTLISTTIFLYNDKDEMIRIVEKNKDGKITSDISSVYDESGNVTERKIRDFHSRTLRFAFDENNNCVEESVYDEHGNLTMKSNYEFDEHNYMVAESGYFLDMNRGSQMANSQSRYEYEFYMENA